MNNLRFSPFFNTKDRSGVFISITYDSSYLHNHYNVHLSSTNINVSVRSFIFHDINQLDVFLLRKRFKYKQEFYFFYKAFRSLIYKKNKKRWFDYLHKNVFIFFFDYIYGHLKNQGNFFGYVVVKENSNRYKLFRTLSKNHEIIKNRIYCPIDDNYYIIAYNKY